jgi:hypothetical protein
VIIKLAVAEQPTKSDRRPRSFQDSIAQAVVINSGTLHMKAIAAVALLCSYACQQSDCILGSPPCSFLSLSTPFESQFCDAYYNTDWHSIATSIANTRKQLAHHDSPPATVQQVCMTTSLRRALLMRLSHKLLTRN